MPQKKTRWIQSSLTAKDFNPGLQAETYQNQQQHDEKVTQFTDCLAKEHCNVFPGMAELSTLLSLPQTVWLDPILEGFLTFYVVF